MTTTTETNHAIENAQGHWETIKASHEACQWLREESGAPDEARKLSREARALMQRHGWDGDNKEDTAEAIEEAAREEALSVEFRCCQWSSNPGEIEPDEYRILLSTGGPALQITGRFSIIHGATSARLQWQDWGTPWTDYDDAEKDALLWFAGLYCLGDC